MIAIASEREEREEAMGGLAKGLAIMESFSREKPRLTVTEAAVLSGATPAAARRCLRTLESLGYVSYDGKFYRPTPRMVRLAQSYAEVEPLSVLAQPRLAALRDAVNESSSLAVLDGDTVIFIARAESTHVVSTGLRVGAQLPAYATATGRVLLAALPDEILEERLRNVRPQRATKNTPATVGAIRASVERVRADGYCLTDEELELGLRAIAVPVVDGTGQTIASMSISVLAARATIEEMIESFLPLLRTEAGALGRMT